MCAAESSQLEYPSRDLKAMSCAENYHKWIAEQFRPFLGRRVAEIRAGTRSFSRLLLAMEIEALIAFDPAATQYPILSQELSAFSGRSKAFNGFLKDVSGEYEGRFDSIMQINVLEHVDKN